MKLSATDTPDLTDAIVRERTGKTLKQWFTHLDGVGGPEMGRRELAQALYGNGGNGGNGKDGKLDEWWSTTLVVEYERARGVVEKDQQPKGYSICSTKTVAAPLERVFQAFGTAKDLDAWLGPGTKADFKDGGALSNADGDRLAFTRIRANKDLRIAWQHPKRAPQSQVEVLFADKGKGKTGITLNHTRIQSRRDADELRAGWSAAFDRLKQHLEGA